MNVNLTPHFEDFVQAQVESGRYGNTSEVMRAALRLLEDYEQERAAKLRDLKAAIEDGAKGPFVPFDIERFIEGRAERKKQARGRHV